jgi:ribonucleoside-diphosphate reductase alpha chain
MINGEVDPEDVFHGVAKEVSKIEKDKGHWEHVFYEMMSSGKFIPGGRILANARPDAKLRQYNNCFVIPIEDSMEGIYEALRQDAVISGQGGGVGFNISTLRPKNAPLSKGGTSSGALSFLKIFNESAKVIQTGGGRRAAHIAIMNVDHPDIEEFITIKHGDENAELTQFNISVGITDKFIRHVEEDLDWDLIFNGKVFKTIKAKYLFDLLAKNAFTHNEPGILNLDHVNDNNTGYWAFDIASTNPCGEIPMPNYSLCCLGAINLTHFVQNPFGPSSYFDFERLGDLIPSCVRFLDNVLDVTDYPLPEIKKLSKQWRRIGLGFTALADTFAMLGMAYGDERSKEFSGELAKFFSHTTYKSSIFLANEKGEFPAMDRDKYLAGKFVKMVLDDKDIIAVQNVGIRNIAMLTIAPTGTTSLTVGQNCSSGIEPIFSLSYDRRIRTGIGDETKTESVHDSAWLEYLFKNKDKTNIVIPEFFRTTLEIDPYDAIDIQAIFQKYWDHSISKTANLPKGYSFDEYKDLWMYAYKNGLKGFTSFNPEGSMLGILQHREEDSSKIPEVAIERKTAMKRPKDLECAIHITSIKGQKFIVLIGLYDGSIYETFVTELKEEWTDKISHAHSGTIRKNGKGDYDLILHNGEETLFIKGISSNFNHEYEGPTRLLSTALRHGTPLEFIVEQLGKSGSFGSWGKSLSQVLKKYIRDGEKVKTNITCPSCGGDNLVYKEGCMACNDCGWGKC